MSHGKQFSLYSHWGAPNGWKVAFVLEELGLTYEHIYLDFGKQEQKGDTHVSLNPNGRIPTLVDHTNGDFAIWESDAILIYLVDKYDKDHKLSFSDEKQRASMIQWLFFQASGQGPYFGQAMWFLNSHPEKIPSAVERYQKETLRVFGVLDGVLKDHEWLVGDKCTIADLSFITWNNVGMQRVLKDYDADVPKQFPAFYAWHQRMSSRESTKSLLDLQASLIEKNMPK